MNASACWSMPNISIMYKLFFGILFLSAAASADEIYKSVDEQGNVTYSQEPVAGQPAEIMKTAPKPDAEQVKAAQEREQKLESTLDYIDKESRQDTVSQAAGEERQGVAGGGAVVIGGPTLRRGTYAEGANEAHGARTAGNPHIGHRGRRAR